MSSENPHGDHINTYNMIKWTLIQILMQLRYLNKIPIYFINQKNYLLQLNKHICF